MIFEISITWLVICYKDPGGRNETDPDFFKIPFRWAFDSPRLDGVKFGICNKKLGKTNIRKKNYTRNPKL